MISSIEIENFQNISKAKLDLDPGINIVIGESDQGKSAIVKALNWLFFNRPQGDAFVRDIGPNKKASRCSVSVALEEGTKVKRYKARDVNAYEINGTKKKALRTDVPEEVSKALNVTETNIQTQFQPFFHLSQSPGQRAKTLNRAVGLNEIDEVIGRVNALARTASTETKRLEAEVEKREAEAAKYQWVGELEEKFELLTSSWDEYKTKAVNLDLLDLFLKEAYQIQEEIDELNTLLKAELDLKRLTKMLKQAIDMGERKAELNSIIGRIEICQEELENWKPYLEAEQMVDDLILKVDEIKSLREQDQKLNSTICEIKDASDAIEGWKEQEDHFKELLGNWKRDNPVCPLCGK